MEKNEVKKYLLKNKELMAKFSHYVSGNLYYNVQIEDNVFQFPIETIEADYIEPFEQGEDERQVIVLSSDLGTTSFESEIKASFLNRWVDKAITKNEFIKVQ